MDELKKALHYVNNANLILNKTMPIADNPKLMIGIIENLNKAIIFTISGILKRKELDATKISIEEAYDFIPEKFKETVNDIVDITKRHKESPVEFVRKEEFIICEDNYSFRTLSVDSMKKYISETIHLIQEVETWKTWN